MCCSVTNKEITKYSDIFSGTYQIIGPRDITASILFGNSSDRIHSTTTLRRTFVSLHPRT